MTSTTLQGVTERVAWLLEQPEETRKLEVISAFRVPSRPMPEATSEAAHKGLRFQRRVENALRSTASSIGGRFESEPWFRFRQLYRDSHAVPDGLFTFGDQQLVIEVKQTFVCEGVEKLRRLYVPVVAKTYKLRTYPLLICRYLTSSAADHLRIETLSEALRAPEGEAPVLHYPGSGPILWSHSK